MKAHPRFPGFSEQRGRIPMTHFARDPVRCSPASLALARPYSPTNFIPTPLAITSMKCASFQKFLYKNKHIQIHLFFPPQLESPHTHPSTEVFLSSPSLDTGIKCPLFNCVIAVHCMAVGTTQCIGCCPPDGHFGLFQFFTIMNSVLIIPLSVHSCTGRTVRWIPESRIVGSEYILFRFY